MYARLLGFGIIGAVVLAVALTGCYLYFKNAETREVAARKQPELDVSSRPSEWCTDSWSDPEGVNTVIGIVRVAQDNREVLERRTLTRVANSDPNYGAELDAAMDRAYADMRVANVHLRRR